MVEKEQAIRLQFLDEAGEYLDTLEAALLGIAQRGVDSQEINGALRAAHSIKGGAALMGYSLTSELAHRLEDSLKVLKIRRGEGITTDVEIKLLQGVDGIRQIVERDRIGAAIDPAWVSEAILPIFDELYEELGEPTAEDAASIMEADEGQNVVPLIFQTEVEAFLERLEELIEKDPPSLSQTLGEMAQELGGLGEMLDLPTFTQLCQSVEHYALGATSAAQKQEVAEKALQAWRRCQALVLTGNTESMPTQLTGMSFGLIAIELAGELADSGAESFGNEADESFEGFDEALAAAADQPLTASQLLSEPALADESPSENLSEDWPEDWSDLGAEDDVLVSDVFAGLGEENDALVEDVFSGFTEITDDSSSGATAEPADDFFAGIFEAENQPVSGASEPFSRGREPSSASPAAEPAAGTAFRFSSAPSSEAPDLSDNTVRVSVRKLNELNDRFGELTIERNRLEAEVRRMRELVKALNRKLRSLDEINDDVRDLYEQPQLLLTGSQPSLALPSSGDSKAAASALGLSLPPLESAALAAHGDIPLNAAAYSNASAAKGAASSAARSDDLEEAATGPAFRQNFDSLEFDRYNDAHLPFRQIVESVVKIQEVADDIELSLDKTEQTTRVIHRTARYLQRNLNQLRMRPLSDITARFPSALRKLELEHGKSVSLVVEGESTLIDRNILEALNDPLMHLVRNAFDHGIEMPFVRESQGKSGDGTIAIRAFNRNGRTLITVSDDGNGIDLGKIRDRARAMGLDGELLDVASESDLLSLIFEPGFSTSEEVTALSGRGVGMDVVRNNLTQVRGDISVDTQLGQGTTFTISLPFTLSVTRVMLAEGNRMPVALPTDMIEEVTVVEPDDLSEVDGREMFTFKGRPIRLIRLANWLAFNCPRQIDSLEDLPNMDGPSVLIFPMGDQRFGLQIDRSWGEQEVAVRRVEGPIALPTGFSNCTILGDGRVVPLVNLPDLARWVLNCEGSNIFSAAALFSNPMANGAVDPLTLQTLPEPVRRRARFLVIDDSVNVRRLLALTLEKAGYEVEQARDGQDALEKLETGLEIDSVVCDVEMPRMDGYSFLSKLRAQPRYADLPVTMLTSRSGEKHRNLAMNLGATAYFSKPYQERVLLESLKASLDEYGGRPLN